MRAHCLGTFFTIAALASIGCSSSEESTPPVPPKDSGSDTSVSDVGDTKLPDVGTDGGKDAETGTGKDCDQHPGDECSMVKQNCPSPGDTCEYDPGATHNTCSTKPPGTATKGEACDSVKNPCSKGLFCYNNKCSPACCTGDDSPCGAKGSCKLAITDSTTKAVIYHVCSYDSACNPFKYDCAKGEDCYYDSAPDVFKCHTPTAPPPDVKPGIDCTYVNDCGESQACFSLTTGGDAGGAKSKCYLFCWLTKPPGWTPGTTPDGRFPADGTCTIGGTNYGKCSSVTGIGGGLGICIPP